MDWSASHNADLKEERVQLPLLADPLEQPDHAGVDLGGIGGVVLQQTGVVADHLSTMTIMHPVNMQPCLK